MPEGPTATSSSESTTENTTDNTPVSEENTEQNSTSNTDTGGEQSNESSATTEGTASVNASMEAAKTAFLQAQQNGQNGQEMAAEAAYQKAIDNGATPAEAQSIKDAVAQSFQNLAPDASLDQLNAAVSQASQTAVTSINNTQSPTNTSSTSDQGSSTSTTEGSTATDATEGETDSVSEESTSGGTTTDTQTDTTETQNTDTTDQTNITDTTGSQSTTTDQTDTAGQQNTTTDQTNIAGQQNTTTDNLNQNTTNTTQTNNQEQNTNTFSSNIAPTGEVSNTSFSFAPQNSINSPTAPPTYTPNTTTSTTQNNTTDNETEEETTTPEPGPAYFSINNVQTTEGTPFSIQIQRSGDLQQTQAVTVSLTIQGNDNASPQDFSAQSKVVNFLAGQANKTVQLDTLDDNLYERTEGLTVVLSNPTNGGILSQATAQAQIENDDPIPQFSVQDAQVSEGEILTFTITRSGDAQAVQSVNYQFSAGQTESTDLSVTPGKLSFSQGVLQQTVTLATTDDTLFEQDEQFQISLSNSTGDAGISVRKANGTLLDNDPTPVFNITSNHTATEGAALRFTVTRTGDAESQQTVRYALNTDQLEQSDYTNNNGILTFTSGQTAQTLTINTNDDSLYETEENFTVSLSQATGGATITTDHVSGTVLDNEPAPQFTIAGAQATEGEAFTFSVTRTGDAEAEQTVNYALQTDSTENDDFTDVSGTLSFAQGETVKTFTVDSSSDTLYEQDEQFKVLLSQPSGGATLATNEATGTILNDDSMPGFSIASASASEGEIITFSVTRSGDAESIQTIQYSFNNSGKAQSTDYSASPGTLTFVEGETVKTFTIDTTVDTLFEDHETFTVSLSQASSGATIGNGTATGTILNDEPAPAFSIDAASASEGDTLTFTVTRTGDAEAVQTVNYILNPESTEQTDHDAAQGILTFSAGETSQQFTVATHTDSLHEIDENVVVSLSNATGGATIDTASATGTILGDNNYPQLNITSTSATEGEALTFSVTRTGDAEAIQTVQYDLSTDTTETDDYSDTRGTLTFAMGETIKTFTVDTVSDSLYEADEQLTVSLSQATGGATIGTDTATGTLLNDEAMPGLNIASAQAFEGEKITFSVTRTGDAEAEQSVVYALQAGDSESSDYSDTQGTLTFATGETVKTFTVDTTEDSLFEENETFSVSLSQTTGDVTLSTDTATGTIINDESAPQLALASATATEGEALTFSVTRTGDAETEQTVQYALSSETTESTDYSDTSGTITFATGETVKTFVVNSTADTLQEEDETFSVSLSQANNGATISQSTASGTIIDDEQATSFSISERSATEGEAITLSVTRTGDAEATQTVEYSVLPGDSEASDYNSTDGTLTFATGELLKTFTVDLATDTLFEGDESFTVSLANAGGGASIAVASASATILDNNTMPSFSVTQPNAVTEGEAVTLTITRTGDAEANQTVEYNLLDNNNDLSTAVSHQGTLTFESGILEKTVVFDTTQDTDVEGNENIAFSLSNATGGATLATDSTTITLIDDDVPPGFSIDNAIQTTEGEAVTFTVNRAGLSTTSETVEYSLAADTSSNSDYTQTQGTLTFAAGETSKTFTVTTTDDTLYEENESFTVSLSNASGGVSITTATATGTLLDNEIAPGFSIASTSANEGQTLTFSVTRQGDADANQTVQYALSAVDAESNDYTSSSGTLTFATGESEKTFTVATTADTLYEIDETLLATLSQPSGGATLTTDTASGTILNDDTAPQFSIASASASEGEMLTMTVSRSGDAEASQTVVYTLTKGDAESDDYTDTNGTLTFSSGITEQLLTIATTADDLYEADETITVSLSQATGGATISTADSATATILNEDSAPELSIQSSGSATEGSDVVLTVTRTGNAEMAQTVEYTLSDGSAQAGSDYTANNGTLTFAKDDTVQSLTIATGDDSYYEADETLSISLTNASIGSLATDQATATIINDDAIPGFSIASASATEGDIITFTVTRSGDYASEQTVEYNLSADSAATTDYTDTSGTLTFASGSASQTFTVSTIQDTTLENDEIFQVSLSQASTDATITTASASGTILTDETALFMQDVSATEGETLTFTLSRSGDLSGALTIDYTLGSGDTENTDFTGTNGTVTFASGINEQLVTLVTTDDTLYEGDESFTFALSNPSTNITLSPAEVTGTILDNDSKPQIYVQDISATEGEMLSFTVSRSGDAEGDQTVEYSLLDGTASANSDYTSHSGTLTFASGDSNKVVTVAVGSDTFYEADETLTISLSNASGDTSITTDSATATVMNDDAKPAFSVSGVSANEGDPLVFTITRSGDTEAAQKIDYVTSGGSATADTDYTSDSGTLTFAQGEGSKLLTINTATDTTVEYNETFFLSLSNAPADATLTSAQATGTILSSDVGLFVQDVTANEGEDMVFTVSRTGDSSQAMTVDFTLSDLTAEWNLPDYSTSKYGRGTTGTVSLDAGVSSQTFTVVTTKDSFYEGSEETFLVSLSNPSNGMNIGPDATGTLIETKNAPNIYSNDTNETFTEGESVLLRVTRTPYVEGTQTVDYSIIAGSATQDDDYMGSQGTLTYASSYYYSTITIATTDNTFYENDETFTVSLTGTNLSESTFGTDMMTITIVDNDPAPTFSIAEASATEGSDLIFTVSRTGGITEEDQLISYTLGHNTTEDGDYTDKTGTLTFSSTTESQTFTIATTQDTISEIDEQLTVSLTNASTVGPAIDITGTGTILTDEGTFSVENVAVEEGEMMTFTITRNGATDVQQTVSYALAAGNTEVGDYTDTSGTVTFAATEIEQTITVATVEDTVYESNENFTLTLSSDSESAEPAFVYGSAVGTINNDEAAPYLMTDYPQAPGTSIEEGVDITITITRTGDAEADQRVSYRFAPVIIRDDNVTLGKDVVGDYYDTTYAGDITFSQGESKEYVIVDVIDDYDVEETEYVRMLFDVRTSPLYFNGSYENSIYVQINDNDFPQHVTIGPTDVHDSDGTSISILQANVTYTISIIGDGGGNTLDASEFGTDDKIKVDWDQMWTDIHAAQSFNVGNPSANPDGTGGGYAFGRQRDVYASDTNYGNQTTRWQVRQKVANQSFYWRLDISKMTSTTTSPMMGPMPVTKRINSANGVLMTGLTQYLETQDVDLIDFV
ncbi:Calx-beta domain-containing protein [Magnetococcales bacterium HHB-1]